MVVRSSSPQEDTHESSMAGQFASVLDVRDWDAFRAAVRTVLDSARHTRSRPAAPMAVLVQPMLTVRADGVLFTADPLTARLDRMLVSAVDGGPDTLVSGARSGTDYHLTRRGRLLRTEPPGGARPLTRAELHRLARLAHRVEQAIGGPQDIEFGFDEDGGPWLFQSRPITAPAGRPARGARLLGPGPVGEATAAAGGRQAEVLARVRQSGEYGRPPFGSPYGPAYGSTYGPASGGSRPRFPGWTNQETRAPTTPTSSSPSSWSPASCCPASRGWCSGSPRPRSAPAPSGGWPAGWSCSPPRPSPPGPARRSPIWRTW
ncbi:PEP/pyruvate-binding domain-containing protein [Streptomyces sp. NPDC020845]|uniref:PEP/pyruvate-binding domain-containing protein n=1 Tax=Streptomyces sp. NPDC020845 TaxID=3365096 RepID=UPI0037A1CA6E